MRCLAIQTTDINTYIYIITSEVIKLREYDASFHGRLMFAICHFVASVRWGWLSRSSSWWGSWKLEKFKQQDLPGDILLELVVTGELLQLFPGILVGLSATVLNLKEHGGVAHNIHNAASPLQIFQSTEESCKNFADF